MNVRWTTPASRELVEVLDGTTERSPQAGVGLRDRIRTIEAALWDNPMLGRRTDELTWLRRIAVSPYPYLIFHEVTVSEVVIHRIRHGSRQPMPPR